MTTNDTDADFLSDQCPFTRPMGDPPKVFECLKSPHPDEPDNHHMRLSKTITRPVDELAERRARKQRRE